MGDLGEGFLPIAPIYSRKDKWIDSCICKESRDLLLASS